LIAAARFKLNPGPPNVGADDNLMTAQSRLDTGQPFLAQTFLDLANDKISGAKTDLDQAEEIFP